MQQVLSNINILTTIVKTLAGADSQYTITPTCSLVKKKPVVVGHFELLVTIMNLRQNLR